MMGSYTLWLKFYSPLIYYQRITLDGIISFCLAIEEARRRENLLAQFCRPQALPAQLQGLNRLNEVIEHKGGAYGVPVASFLQPVGAAAEYLDSWKKRWDSEFSRYACFGKGKRVVNTSSGEFRSYNMPLPAHVISVGYFAFVGDGPEVMRLIQENIIGIGKKVNVGFGWIDRLELKESTLEWRDILRMRPVPISIAQNHGIEGARRICGWKPPYWERRNICECVVPE